MFAFVEHYVDLGARHQGRAAIMAGYSKTAADAVASGLLRRADVLAQLRHIVETRIKADVVMSAETLKELRDSPATPAAVRRQCANDLLDRADLLVEKFSTVHHVVEQRSAPIGTNVLEMLRKLAPDMGIELVARDQAKLDHFLAVADRSDDRSAPAVIDGEFVDVDDGEPAAQLRREGSEDLLN
jgi:hypothetical protein